MNQTDEFELDDYSQNSFDVSDDEDEVAKDLLPAATTNTTTTTSPHTTSSATTNSTTTTTTATPSRATPSNGNSFYARLNSLSAGRSSGGTTSLLNVSRTQPSLTTRGGSPVRTRLEKLSNRLAARAQQIAQDKRERESAILDHVQALERKLDANNARMNDMERQHSSLLEELGEERKARLLLETSYQEEITSLTHRVGRLKQDIDAKLDNELNGRKMEVQEQLENIFTTCTTLTTELKQVTTRMTATEQMIPNQQQLTLEVKRLIEIERKVKVETECMLMKLLGKGSVGGRGGCGGRCIPMKITKHSNPSWRDEFRRSLLDMHLRKYVVVVGGVVVGFDCVIHPCYLFFDLQFFLQTTPFHSFGQTWTMRKKPEKGTRRRCCKYWRT